MELSGGSEDVHPALQKGEGRHTVGSKSPTTPNSGRPARQTRGLGWVVLLVEAARRNGGMCMQPGLSSMPVRYFAIFDAAGPGG